MTFTGRRSFGMAGGRTTGGIANGAELSEPRANRRADRAHRLRLDRSRHAAADRASLHLRPAPGLRHRPARRRAHLPRAAGRALHPPCRHARELPCALDPALPRRARLLRQPLGRHQLARADAPRARARRPLRRHGDRAMGGALLRPLARPRRPHQLRAARDGAGREAGQPGRDDRRQLLRREPRHGVVAAQGGAAAPRRRPRPAGRGAARPRRLGAADAGAGRQGRAHRRARHPVRARRQADRQLRQHLVGGGLRLRELPAGRARLGHARALVPAERPPAGARLQGGDLPRHAGDPDQGAHLDAGGRGRNTAISSPTTRRSRSPTISPSARAERRSSGRPATTPTTPATRRCSRSTRRSGRARRRRR